MRSVSEPRQAIHGTAPGLGLVELAVVIVVSLAFLSQVFKVFHQVFWTHGLGNWLDPYFINAILEHWYRSFLRFEDPSSPPIYFPVENTLGYSHGLVLYAPFYALVRPFFHPFQAYSVALLIMMEVGIVCLYVIFRKVNGLSFIESLVLCAFFFTSRNVVHAETGVWSQRASVFLVPPILLMLLLSHRMPEGRRKLMLAGLSGVLGGLLFTQDFYTGLFTLLVSVLVTSGYLLIYRGGRIVEKAKSAWRRERSSVARFALVTFAVAALWSAFVFRSGGGTLHVFGVTARSHDWRRPALVAFVALAVWIRIRGVPDVRTALTRISPWLAALGTGLVIGGGVFVWIYLPAYLEHRAFSEDDLMNLLARRDPSRWQGPLDVLGDLNAYTSLRPFILIVVLGTAAWLPWLRIERPSRLYWLWLLVISSIVVLVPLRFDDMSIWKTFFRPVPGFAAIRDPKRIIHLYELAVVLVTALLIAQLPRKAGFRTAAASLVVLLIVADWNRQTFGFHRAVAVYERWVAAPIAIDRLCTSFFVKGASDEYMARSDNMRTQYAIDSMFVALNGSLPTLNGYSAWSPGGWELHGPHEAGYAGRVQRWIDRHNLDGVCEFDIDRRTMKRYNSRLPQ